MKTTCYGRIKNDRWMVREPQYMELHDTKYAYYPEFTCKAIHEKIEMRLQEAIELEQIQLFLQPRVCLNTGTVCAAEALVRWQWADGHWSLPAQFLPVLEQENLVPRLDQYMLEQTAQLLQQWERQYQRQPYRIKPPIPIAVNLSTATVEQPDFVEQIKQIVCNYQLRPEQIELELTEHRVAKKEESVRKTLCILQQEGFTLCLDDFGTGNSSLATLLTLPVPVVKLDQQFLNMDFSVEENYNYLFQMVQFLKMIEKKIVAEGVETEEQKTLAMQLGIDQGQGWYWQRPLHWRIFLQKYFYNLCI